MKYHIYAIDSSNCHTHFNKIGELRPGASLECSWFGSERLWNPETGFRRGQFKIDGFWVIDDEEHAEMQLEEANRQED